MQQLTPTHKLAVCLAAGVAVRLACFAIWPESLQRRPELTSPLTSFRSLQEGVFLFGKGDNPYTGGVFYYSPIYLAIFSHLQASPLLWVIADLMGALALSRIDTTRCSDDKGYKAAALYLFNPYILLSCLARSTAGLENAVLLWAICGRTTNDLLLSGTCLAFVSHTSIYPILLLPPLLKGLSSRQRAILAGAFAVVFGTIAAGNTLVFGSSWIRPTWGTILTVSDLTPNVGMWWYFFTEMFDHFRQFFLGVFQLHTAIYVLPVCLRIEDPLHATLILLGVISTWKSYPTLADLGVWAGLLGCFPEITANLRHPLFTLATYLHTFILLPLLHSLWLLTGTGNANFFYAATMVHGLNSALAVVDVVTAVMRFRLKKVVQWKDTYKAVQITAIE
ncbi:putative cell division cycle protein 91 [Dioszegia hungarica]|uniref:Cell division cycle protein 91 n=1 Tax=Dioszegia hungarica TaxID=4972 RepID=A0AA38HF05_9TREE|nr:putative cell division cycle protein 91 [Dioszegia hungarica]KAI9639400.1 putative cell division cycle protein 91 [Dioszegia hungarica]